MYVFLVIQDFTPFFDGLGEYFPCVASCLANFILGLDINLSECFVIINSCLVTATLAFIAWYIDMWMSYYHRTCLTITIVAFSTWYIARQVDIWCWNSLFNSPDTDMLIIRHWYVILDTWFLTLDIWHRYLTCYHLTPDTWHLIYDTWQLIDMLSLTWHAFTWY